MENNKINTSSAITPGNDEKSVLAAKEQDNDKNEVEAESKSITSETEAEPEDEMLYYVLDSYYENNVQAFSALIRVALSYLDPFMYEEGRLTDEELISMAKDDNITYLNLYEIFDAFQDANRYAS